MGICSLSTWQKQKWPLYMVREFQCLHLLNRIRVCMRTIQGKLRYSNTKQNTCDIGSEPASLCACKTHIPLDAMSMKTIPQPPLSPNQTITPAVPPGWLCVKSWIRCCWAECLAFGVLCICPWSNAGRHVHGKSVNALLDVVCVKKKSRK